MTAPEIPASLPGPAAPHEPARGETAVPAGSGMTASQAVTRIAALPARAATTETAPVRADPGTGA